jgi:hypothetical protein
MCHWNDMHSHRWQSVVVERTVGNREAGRLIGQLKSESGLLLDALFQT